MISWMVMNGIDVMPIKNSNVIDDIVLIIYLLE